MSNFIEKVNFCPVCGEKDGTYKESMTICGRYQTSCKKCEEDGWSYVTGIGATMLSYKGREINIDKIRKPYKKHLREDCFCK